MRADESLRLPAQLESLEPFRALALRAADRAGLPAEAVGRMELVLEEALVNIVRHAYGAGEGEMELDCGVPEPGRVVLVLRDWGAPFDPLHVRDQSLEDGLVANLEADLDDREPGGMGLFFIRSMSQASYSRVAEANELTLGIA
ncbi:ATP-binding protein [Humidesulfovibrio idahonensis]